MIRVNLLPHRQVKRAERQREFGLMAAFAAFAAAAIIFLGYTFISSQVEAQTARNSRLDEAIVKLDKEIADIKDLKDQISICWIESKWLKTYKRIAVNRSLC